MRVIQQQEKQKTISKVAKKSCFGKGKAPTESARGLFWVFFGE